MTKIHGNCNTREKIEKQINKTDSCWLWTGNCDRDGYGRVRFDGKETFMHRLMHTWYNGPIPDGYIILHSCDNPPCCNPKHLSAGTHADNIADAVAKGRKSSKGMSNPNHKLTEFQVQAIRGLHDAGMTMRKLALMFDVSRRCISNIINGRSWESLPAVEGVTELGDADSKISADELDAIGVQASKQEFALSKVTATQSS